MQEHLLSFLGIFVAQVTFGFLNDVFVIFICKTDPANPFEVKIFGKKTLNTMPPYGPNIDES